MRKNFRTYNLAVEFYKSIKTLNLSTNLKNQLERACSSVALNLAEGSGRRTIKDQIRFFNIAFASLRESQAILDLEAENKIELIQKADCLAAHIYKLIKNCSAQ